MPALELSKKAYLTLSVDDGHPLDFKAAEMLAKYGLSATFYIPRFNPEREVLDEPAIRELGRAFEVGGHTLSHLPLTNMRPDQSWREISVGKAWLEGVLGHKVRSFCYPRGKFNRSIVRMAEKAGYIGSRTCMQNLTSFPSHPHLWGVTTQAYSHSRMVQVRHALIEGNFEGAAKYFTVHKGAVDWETHFKAGIDHISSLGGVAHLYFHSWEIEEQGQWDKLDRVLAWLGKQPELERLTNGELFEMRVNGTLS